MLHRSQYLLAACAALCGGMLVGVLLPGLPWVWAGFLGGLAAAPFANGWLRLVCIGLIALCCGYARAQLVAPLPTNPYDQHIDIRIQVAQEPQLRLDEQRLVVASQGINGLIQVAAPLQPRWQVGDELQLQCRLRQPQAFDGFAYDKYLQRHHISGLCYYPQLTFIQHQASVQTKIFAAKRWLRQRITGLLPAPEQGVVLGMLFGDKQALPDDVNNAFRQTGTSHVLVISGMHVAILSLLVLHLLQLTGLRRRSAVILLLALLTLYVFATGVQASAVRSVSFAAVTISAELLDRVNTGLRGLLFVATGMLLINPLLLPYDIGFQLSVAATAGIIWLAPRLQPYLRWVPNSFDLRQIAAVSVAAFISTAPIIAWQFRTLSIVAIAVNLVVVPLMPLLMFGSIATTIAAALHPSLGQILAIPLYSALHILLLVVRVCARIPFASITL